jgi:hypothetical protein
MKLYLLYCYCLFLMPVPQQPVPKSWETFKYQVPPIKLHHMVRVTMRFNGNLATMGDPNFVDKVM